MSQIIHTKSLGNHIRSLIWDNLKVSLSLKAATLGTVEFYESIEELSGIVPIVFVNPSPGVNVQIRTMGLHYTLVYKYRLLFVKTYAVGDNVVEDKINATDSIAELIFDNVKLTGLTLSNAEVEKCVPTNIEYNPIEEGFLTLIRGGQFVGCAVAIECTTHTSAP